MKRLFFKIVFIVFFVFSLFNLTAEQEEIDHLIFLPNSSYEFVNGVQAGVQLDNLAGYLINRNLNAGEIFVYGYAAFAANDIDADDISIARARFVIAELQRRGVPGNLFADPIGLGSVYLWGSNEDEREMSPNRRVVIMLKDDIVTPQITAAVEPIIVPVIQEPEQPKKAGFPWWILLIPILFLLLKFRKKPNEKVKTAPVHVTAHPLATTRITLNLDEEIRNRAYELYLRHRDQYVDVEGDWYQAVIDVSVKYYGDGYYTYYDAETWWACKTVEKIG